MPKVTITRGAIGHDQVTGLRASQTAQTILLNHDCTITYDRSATRQAYSRGLREVVKPTYSMLIEDATNVVIQLGDKATVTYDDGKITAFTVDAAELVRGLTADEWVLDLSQVQS